MTLCMPKDFCFMNCKCNSLYAMFSLHAFPKSPEILTLKPIIYDFVCLWGHNRTTREVAQYVVFSPWLCSGAERMVFRAANLFFLLPLFFAIFCS